MPLKYKIDVLSALKEKGYNTNKIRTEGLLSQSTLQKFRNQQGVSWENLETLCRLLDCQPADIIEYVKEPAEGVNKTSVIVNKITAFFPLFSAFWYAGNLSTKTDVLLDTLHRLLHILNDVCGLAVQKSAQGFKVLPRYSLLVAELLQGGLAE